MKHRLIFSRGRCLDGSLFTTVALDDTDVVDRTEPGKKPPDPVIMWCIDLRFQGNRLPADPEGAFRWLREQRDVVRAGLTWLATRIPSAVSPDDWPLFMDIPDVPPGVGMSVFAHAIRPMTLAKMGSTARGLRKHWDKILDQLEPSRPASAESA